MRLLCACLGLLATLVVVVPASGAAPRASISGDIRVGATVTVRTVGGRPTGVRWERCTVPVKANRCARATRLGSGRTLLLTAASEGKSIRAVMRVRGRVVRTRFSRPVAATPAPTRRLVVPPQWQVTGSQDTLPFAPGMTPAQKEETILALNTAYAALDAQVRGGRVLVHSEALGDAAAGILTEITLDLCSANNAFSRRVTQAGLGTGGTTTVTGTWRIVLDLTTSVTPALVLTDAAGTPLREAMDLVDTSRVMLAGRTYTTGPSSVCA